jgi:hypothetical protein
MQGKKKNYSHRNPMTQWGLDVTLFCARHCILKKHLAQEAGIGYSTLLKAMKGTRSDRGARAAVQPVIDRYEAEAQKSGAVL